MKRRLFLCGAACAAALETNPLLADERLFHWRRPGWEPYDQQNRRAPEALNNFRDLLVRDPDVEAEFLRKVQAGQYTPALVYPGWRTTRMMFGGNKKAPNVVVDDSDFAAWGTATKKVRMYTAERTSGNEVRFYALFYPEVCGNWSIRLGQRVCEYDSLLCDQGCQQLKREQYHS